MTRVSPPRFAILPGGRTLHYGGCEHTWNRHDGSDRPDVIRLTPVAAARWLADSSRRRACRTCRPDPPPVLRLV